MRRTTVAAAVLSALAAMASAAEEGVVEIGIADLVEGMGPRTPRLPVSRPWPVPGTGFPLQADDDSHLSARGAAIEASDLPAALQALMGGEAPDCEIARGRLRVPAAAAPAVRDALARIRARRPGFVEVEYALEAGGAAGWKCLLSGREPVLSGDRAVFTDARDRALLLDFDPNIAQDAQIPSPVMAVQRTGSGLVVRVLPLPRGDAAAVEVVACASEPLARAPADTGYSEMAPIDRGAVSCEEARVTLRAEPGKESVHRWTGRDGRTMRVRLTARWAVPPADAGAGAVFSSPLFVQPLLSHGFVGYRLLPPAAAADEAWPRFGGATERHLAYAAEQVNALATGGTEASVEAASESGLVVLGGKDAAPVRDALFAEVAAGVRGARAEIAVFDVAAGAGDAAGGRELFRVAGPVLVGLGSCWSAGEGRTYIAGYDTEVAQGAFLPGPQMDTLLTGFFANLRLLPGPEGAPAMAEVDFQWARLDGVETTRIPVLVPVNRTGASPSGTPAGRPERSAFVVEKPAVREVRVTATVPLGADGKAVLRRAAPGLLGEGRELLLTVAVARP